MTIGRVKIPTSWDELYVGRFLKAGLLKDKQVTLTIKSVIVETMPNEKDNTEKDRGIVSFEETPLQLALNRTNGECLKAMMGKKVQTWVGKKVTLAPEMTKFGREDVEAIRIAGAPWLTSNIELEIKMPKRKPQKRVLVPTKKGATASVSQPDQVNNQSSDPETGEVTNPITPEEIQAIQKEESAEGNQ
jgi:hypothetical protein